MRHVYSIGVLFLTVGTVYLAAQYGHVFGLTLADNSEDAWAMITLGSCIAFCIEVAGGE